MVARDVAGWLRFFVITCGQGGTVVYQPAAERTSWNGVWCSLIDLAEADLKQVRKGGRVTVHPMRYMPDVAGEADASLS